MIGTHPRPMVLRESKLLVFSIACQTQKRHFCVMEDFIKVGFQSQTINFEAEMTVDRLLEIMIEHVPTYHEFAAAAELLVPLLVSSGRYDGTDWNFWFVKAELPVTIH